MDWILRIEGVNLNDTVFNTNQLSVIRGSSQVLEAFGYELAHIFAPTPKKDARIIPLQTASCIAAFALKDMTRAEAEEVQKRALDRLHCRHMQDANRPPFFKPGHAPASGPLALFLNMPSEHMTFVQALVPMDSPNVIRLPDTLNEKGGVGPDPADPETALGNLRKALNTAQTIGRRQQYASPNLPTSPPVKANARVADRAAAQCLIDPAQQVGAQDNRGNLVWMATDQLPKAWSHPDDKGKKVQRKLFSTRSAHLRKYGRDARQKIYGYLLDPGQLKGLENRGLFDRFGFAQSVEDIHDPGGMDGSDALRKALRPSLAGKLAVLYVDGNGFSALANAAPVAFPMAMRKTYARMMEVILGRYLEMAAAEGPLADAWRHPDELPPDPEDRKGLLPLRLETLTVGGDDAILILPAWLAFEIAPLILQTLEDEAQRHHASKGATFRAGLAIAPAGAPFRRLRNLAYALMNDAKHATEKAAQSTLSVQIVESMDLRDADDALDDLRRVYGGLEGLGVAAAGAALRWTLARHPVVMQGIRDLKDPEKGFSRVALIRIAQELDSVAAVPDEPRDIAVEKALAKAVEVHANRSGKSMLYDKLLAALPGDGTMSPALRIKAAVDIWDYVDPLADLAPVTGGTTT